ncbi:MAG: hypothetical protein R3C56_33950 [Pirellulaceae bacterium]
MPATCYDCFFLFDSNKYNRDPGGVIAEVHKVIEDLRGEILASRLWEERVSHPIDGHMKGPTGSPTSTWKASDCPSSIALSIERKHHALPSHQGRSTLG